MGQMVPNLMMVGIAWFKPCGGKRENLGGARYAFEGRCHPLLGLLLSVLPVVWVKIYLGCLPELFLRYNPENVVPLEYATC